MTITNGEAAVAVEMNGGESYRSYHGVGKPFEGMRFSKGTKRVV